MTDLNIIAPSSPTNETVKESNNNLKRHSTNSSNEEEDDREIKIIRLEVEDKNVEHNIEVSPVGLQLLSESQQQQLLQAYVQTQANLNASSLATISTNLLELPQEHKVITTLPTTNKKTARLSNDEKRQRRLLRNRIAAKECRKKKKLHIQDMEEKIAKLEQENTNLINQVEELKAKLSIGKNLENYRLMKEVEELNAKLNMAVFNNIATVNNNDPDN